MTKSQINAALDGQMGQCPLLNSPEISVWMTAFGCLREISDIASAFQAKKISSENYYRSVNHMLVELAETADDTHRFGVLLPSSIEPNYKKRAGTLKDGFLQVEFSFSFWQWYNWWDDYMKAIPLDARNELYKLVTYRLPEVERYRPQGDWISHRREPALMLCQT